MIVFLIGSLLILEDVEDVVALPDVKVVIDIAAGLSSICTCPEQGCDDSACRFSSNGLYCTGTCSSGDLLCDLDDLTAPAHTGAREHRSAGCSADVCRRLRSREQGAPGGRLCRLA